MPKLPSKAHETLIKELREQIEETRPLVDKYQEYLSDWQTVSEHDNLTETEARLVEVKRKESAQRYGHWYALLKDLEERLSTALGIGMTKTDTEEPYDLGQE